MKEKKELTPIEEQTLDQVRGGYINPAEIMLDRIFRPCPYCGANLLPGELQDHQKKCPKWPKEK